MKVVLCGAGKIGRVSIARYALGAGHELTMLDAVPEMVDCLAKAGQYQVRTVGRNIDTQETVKGYKIYMVDSQEAEAAIAQADVLFTSVGVNNMGSLAKTIAPMILKRKGAVLPVFLYENKIGVDTLAESCFREAAGDHADEIMEKIHLVSGCVGVVSAPTDSYLECVKGPFDTLHYDADQEPEGFSFPSMVGVRPFEFYIREKIFIYNMSHALGAYLGMLKGYKNISESCEDPEIGGLMHASMQATGQALLKEFDVSEEEMQAAIEDIFDRINNPFFYDPCIRIGYNPKRKLFKDDRLTGGYLYVKSKGIRSEAHLKGIAAGFLYDNPEDPTSVEILTYVKEQGIRKAVEKYTGLEEAEEIEEIVALYEQLKKEYL